MAAWGPYLRTRLPRSAIALDAVTFRALAVLATHAQRFGKLAAQAGISPGAMPPRGTGSPGGGRRPGGLAI